MQCLACGQLATRSGVCARCKVPYEKAWCIGERVDALERLINDYKFQRAQAIHSVLGDLLLETLPDLPRDTVVVPIPTIAAHVRQRGYDHALLLARYVARRRGFQVEPLLRRAESSVQHRVNRQQRLLQAQGAFAAATLHLDASRPYLIVDDVVTTGATIQYAAKMLQSAGARHIWVAAVAWQPPS